MGQIDTKVHSNPAELRVEQILPDALFSIMPQLQLPIFSESSLNTA
jgi:hypothetical protein